VFNRIENDMESLCDSRVLERLEGEERRLYGGILLAMASEKYARVPGTTSISNGGRNISRRIEALVRFRKYPKGMGLVSVCIALVLAIPPLPERCPPMKKNGISP
jgi:beta-lactamase regulating signal transducer with metallopeptidase domain